MTSRIDSPQPFLRVYPNESAVFGGDVARHRRHMVPLLSVDLSAVHRGWRGWIHVVSPHEPWDGAIGRHTRPYHAGYLQENWLAFRLDDRDQYHLLGDWRFFYAECVPPEAQETTLRSLQNPTRELEDRCQRQKNLFAAMQKLPCPCKDTPYALVDCLGGPASYDNWCSGGLSSPVPVNVKDREDVYPITPEGRRFHFVCFVQASHYGHHEHGIVLFFEPGSRTALLTFN